jgi:hypothetical protein
MTTAYQRTMFGDDEALPDAVPAAIKLTRRHYAPAEQTDLYPANELLAYPELPAFVATDRVNSARHDPLSQEAVAELVDYPTKRVVDFEREFLAKLKAMAERLGAKPTKATLESAFMGWERERREKLSESAKGFK